MLVQHFPKLKMPKKMLPEDQISLDIDNDEKPIRFGDEVYPPPVVTVCSSLKLAIAHMGGQVVAAKKLKLTQQAVSRWVVRGYAPVNYARALCLLSNFPAIDLIDPEIKKIADLLTPVR